MMPKYSRTKMQTARARQLRHGDNPAEGALWNMLKAKRLGGFKFVRQMPVGPFYADFVQPELRLVIEVDASQHVDSDSDRRRDAFMRGRGYSVLRVWSGDVLRDRESIGAIILAALNGEYREDIIEAGVRFVKAD